MRNFLIIIVLFLLGMSQAMAQEQEYTPFVREGVKWVYTYYLPSYTSNAVQRYSTLELKGDYIIDGQTYKAMHKYSGAEINWEDDTIPVYLREEEKVVYGIVPDGKTYTDCPVGIESDATMLEKIAAGEEFVLYDFNDPVAFIESFVKSIMYPVCKVIADEATVSGKKVKRYIFNHKGNDYCLVEGIGFDSYYGYPIAIQNNPLDDSNHYRRLSHVVEGGEIIYTSESSKFLASSMEYDAICNRPPLAREGVQWVNERVIVDHGDTTRYYYTYEFRGVDNRQFSLLYSYTGDSLDLSTATVVAKVQSDGYTLMRSDPAIYANQPLMKVIEEDRDMIDFQFGNMLYSFEIRGMSDISSYYTHNYYIYHQKEPFLTRQNLVELEPLEIESVTCQRFAYIDEQGEPIAYIVEGIGFDSRDMGDLLTPFTKRPDPDADYQEWWGLSHVVKDGKIIYKGMCYDPVKFGDLNYDVNSDGVVNITDVTILISMLIGESTTLQQSSATGDVNDDGHVNISDVTALINYVTNH